MVSTTGTRKKYAPQVRVSVIHYGEGMFHIEAWSGSQRENRSVEGVKTEYPIGSP